MLRNFAPIANKKEQMLAYCKCETQDVLFTSVRRYPAPHLFLNNALHCSFLGQYLGSRSCSGTLPRVLATCCTCSIVNGTVSSKDLIFISSCSKLSTPAKKHVMKLFAGDREKEMTWSAMFCSFTRTLDRSV